MASTGLESGCNSDGSPYILRGSFTSLLRLAKLAALACLFVPGVIKAQTSAQIHDQVGYTQLKTVLGNSLPIGAGVAIAQIEADSSGSPGSPVYHPITGYSDFLATDDPFSQPVIFTDASGGLSNGESNHATTSVGQFFYGNNFSFAPGANEVTIYEANHWLSNVLKINGGTPANSNFRVQNFSWVGTYSNVSLDAQVLGRFDYLIDNNNITAVVGNNLSTTPNALLIHSLNAITVGISAGGNPTLPTQSYYFPGRNKPDIVSPAGASSTATASVASAATMLHHSAAGTDATQSETMKAILLAGATKTEFPSWNHTPSQPLDSNFGAGELNVYNSYLIQSGGQHTGSPTQPSGPVSSDAWDYGVSSFNTPLYYTFEVPADSTATELSIALTWNADVTDSSQGSSFTPDVSLENLDLRFYDSSNSFLETEIDSSISTANNVEHLHLLGLSEGTYTLELSNQTPGGSRDFGLAWRMETLFNDESADFDTDNDTDGYDFLAWQRNFGNFTGSTLAEGDGDGDGDTDMADLLIFDSEFGASAGATVARGSVPEPSAAVLGAVGMIMLYLFQRFRWSTRSAG